MRSDFLYQNKWLIGMAMTLGVSLTYADTSGQEILNAQCQSCHSLKPNSVQTLQDLWDRKGPDLSSAGIKYKAEWMNKWLQNPVRLRPSGMFYGNHIKKGVETDEIDSVSLVNHPKLKDTEAEKVTAVLMTLTHNKNLVTSGDYKPGTISMTLGDMMFDKFKGCLACHQIEPEYGGISGPEVYSAAERLQEDYLISFMRNPQAWEPKTFMPNKNLKESDLQKLVHYLRGLSQENIE